MFIKFIGYVLIATGSLILASIGYDVHTWQWWAIIGCLVCGSYLTSIEIEYMD